MQMVTTAHYAGLGSCWNHFCKDFVYSRPKNIQIFNTFYKTLEIPKTIEPIAIIAFGKPAFHLAPSLRPTTTAVDPKSKRAKQLIHGDALEPAEYQKNSQRIFVTLGDDIERAIRILSTSTSHTQRS